MHALPLSNALELVHGLTLLTPCPLLRAKMLCSQFVHRDPTLVEKRQRDPLRDLRCYFERQDGRDYTDEYEQLLRWEKIHMIKDSWNYLRADRHAMPPMGRPTYLGLFEAMEANRATALRTSSVTKIPRKMIIVAGLIMAKKHSRVGKVTNPELSPTPYFKGSSSTSPQASRLLEHDIF
ncbi:hypothetical protein XA68_15906 [Ophiocordyceps unilateralis]|uniref:Uncharacterized protein n=1 Tax=Ophiocordyceps unilateralis TaxID=268505 RepID=A0A2A9PLY2_OPHUN|nr:hypothetical protein XA68_15906 [Ophiocordyceps unilateralis]